MVQANSKVIIIPRNVPILYTSFIHIIYNNIKNALVRETSNLQTSLEHRVYKINFILYYGARIQLEILLKLSLRYGGSTDYKMQTINCIF